MALIGTVIAGVVTGAGAALAAYPKSGKYKGSTSATAINGYKPPVRFTVSSSGTQITKFTWGSTGCFGSGGGFPPGNPWTGGLLHTVNGIPVTSTGKFSKKNAKSVYKYSGGAVKSETTTTTVTGRFKGKKAHGTITYSQRLSNGQHCGPYSVTFTAHRG
jgi:hypothetical protein